MTKKMWRPLHWAWAGVLLGILNVIIMNVYVANRPIGASTAFPYLGAWLTGMQHAVYAKMIAKPGLWEVWFLVGAFAGALVSSLLAGNFKIQLVPDRWQNVHGPSASKRIFWAVIGTILLISGARLAGGCTSGHILSGGMQLAVSSLIFGAVVMISFLITGRIFYRR